MAVNIRPEFPSLVRYDNPVLVSKQDPKEAPKKSTSPVKQTDDVLHSILPPREWEEENQLWQQKVSSTPATRLDVITLQEQLDLWLQRREARETGICPVRRELYSQCFGM